MSLWTLFFSQKKYRLEFGLNGKKFMYEHFAHGADIGIRGIGKSIAEAFEMAALSLTAVVTFPEKISQEITIQIALKEDDIELLFLDWINALIYEMDTKKILFSSFEVKIENGQLNALIKGERINRKKHDAAVDIKGATMTELKVIKENNQWIAQCVVDV